MAEEWARRIGGRRLERRHHEWTDSLPVVLRSAVHAPISTGRFRQPWSQRLVLVKWVIRGEAVIGVSGRRIPFGPGEIAIYTPIQPHQFWCNTPDTWMCWFSIDGPLMEQFVHILGLRAGVYEYGPAPTVEIDRMIDSLTDQSLEGCRRSSLLAVQMLYKVCERLPPPQVTGVVQQVRHLIQEGLADPDLSAQRIANQLNYNRGALSRIFHQQAGATIIDCITQTRLQEAEMLLTRSDERIGDIARKCGFRDLSYFTRWIKKHTGRLPRDLRASAVDGFEEVVETR